MTATANAPDLAPDLEGAAAFIAALTGEGNGWDTPVSLRTFTDDRVKKATGQAEAELAGKKWRDQLEKNFHGTLRELAAELERRNRKGAGIYVVVNAGAGEVRADKDVTRIRALFVDDDHGTIADPAALKPAPSIVVRTKQGCHVYWLPSAPIPVAEFREAQRRLIHNLKTDTCIKNESRIMRLPGFYHMKDPTAPLLIRAELLEPARRYDALEVLAHYPAPPPPPLAAVAPLIHGDNRDEVNFFKWCATKGIADGERNRNLMAILTQGRGRVQAGAISEEAVLRAMLDYRERSGIGRTERQVRDLWAGAWRAGGYNANLPTRTEATAAVPSAGPARAASAANSSDERSASAERIVPQTISAAELMTRVFEEPRWAVPGLLPEGLTVLAGRPKLGKSWLAFGLCLAVAYGGYAFGKHKVDPGEALYVALEDNDRRLQKRLRQMLEKAAPPAACHMLTTLPPMHMGGLDQLDAWLDLHPACRLIVIDTLSRFRPPPARGMSAYDADYAALGPLQHWALRRGVTLLIVTHVRKAPGTDVFDLVTGSLGITGAADCAWVLERARGEADAILHITGRDIEEQELAMRADLSRGAWTVMGDAEEYRGTQEQREVLEALRENGPMKPKEIAEAIASRTGKPCKSGTIRARLIPMSNTGMVRRRLDGNYELLTPNTPNGANDPNEANTPNVCGEALGHDDLLGAVSPHPNGIYSPSILDHEEIVRPVRLNATEVDDDEVRL